MTTRTIPMFIIVYALFALRVAFGQTSLEGNLQDTILEMPVPNALLTLYSPSDSFKTTSDNDGYFSFKNVLPGNYNLKINYMGNTTSYQDIKAIQNKSTYYYLAYNPYIMLEPVNVPPPVVIDPVNIVGWDIDDKDIQQMGERDFQQIAAQSPSVVETPSGGLSFRGSRPDATLYYVDDMRIIGEPAVSLNGVDYIKVYNGGLPAKYGNTTGGLIVIETKSFMSY